MSYPARRETSVFCLVRSSMSAPGGYASTASVGDDEAPTAHVSIGQDMGGPVVTRIVAGASHTCAPLDDGEVHCRGLGSLGRLGYADTENVGDDETPNAAGSADVGVR